MSASYNVRMIRARHDRMESDPINHPLLSPDEETVRHLSLSVEQEAWVYQTLINQAESEHPQVKMHAASTDRPRHQRTLVHGLPLAPEFPR